MQPTSIRHIGRSEIDAYKWDACIDAASNGLIYGYSFYLDRMAKHWDALVLDDYKAVMPLPWNKKSGFYYLYQPAFTPSLGVFGNNLTESLVRNFGTAIPEKFKLAEINLNAGNIFSIPTGFQQLKHNYILDLNHSYDELYAAYRENIRRNIKKCLQLGCRVENNLDIEKLIGLANDQLSTQTNTTPGDLENFKSLYFHLASNKLAEIYGIFHQERLLSGAAYFFSHGRAYYILVGNHPNSKSMGSSHYLIDRFIHDHAGQNLVLDFEGSDIPSLAFFYSSFGAKVEHYPALKLNRLPWYVRWFK